MFKRKIERERKKEGERAKKNSLSEKSIIKTHCFRFLCNSAKTFRCGNSPSSLEKFPCVQIAHSRSLYYVFVSGFDSCCFSWLCFPPPSVTTILPLSPSFTFLFYSNSYVGYLFSYTSKNVKTNDDKDNVRETFSHCFSPFIHLFFTFSSIFCYLKYFSQKLNLRDSSSLINSPLAFRHYNRLNPTQPDTEIQLISNLCQKKKQIN